MNTTNAKVKSPRNASGKKRKPIPWKSLLPWFIIAGVILVVLGAAAIHTLLTQGSAKKAYRFDYIEQDGTYYDADRDITYVPIPFCYEAVLNESGEPYATSDFQSLYRIGYRDETDNDQVHLKKATSWLATSKSVGGQVYYNPQEVRFPAFSEFDWDVIYFTNPDSSQYSTYTMDAETSDRLMRDFVDENAENLFETHYNSSLDAKLLLKVRSSTYQWLYLNLLVLADEEGNYYICQEGVVMEDNPRLIAIDSAYFEDYLKTLEDIIEGNY